MALMCFTAAWSTTINYKKYGSSWNVTTTIGDTTVIQGQSISVQLLSLLLICGITVVFIFNILTLRDELKSTETETSNNVVNSHESKI